MKVLFLARLYWPHIGGVEKPLSEISQILIKRGYKITVVTEKFDGKLRDRELKVGVKIFRFNYPQIKFFGLVYIWIWLLLNRDLIKKSDIVHCHDVFIWYLPFRFLYPNKPVYTTFHGWEGIYPIQQKNILIKKLSNKLSWGSMCMGKFIEKYYGIMCNFVIYGGTDIHQKLPRKVKNTAVYVGRLEKDTGLPIFLKELARKKTKIIFCGDGSLKPKCEKVGKVLGFVNPNPYLAKAEYCYAGGYLSALEGMSYRCKLKVAWNNPLKKDYWLMTPFYRYIKSKNTKEAYLWVKQQSWRNLTNKYLQLWKL